MVWRLPISKPFITGLQKTIGPWQKAVVACVFASVEPLASFPHIEHAGRDEGALEWVVPRRPYIVIYEIHPSGTW
jgi:hypothetical protein